MIEWIGTPYFLRGYVGEGGRINFIIRFKQGKHTVWQYDKSGRNGAEFDTPFELQSEAKQWCEMMAATGALE